MQRLAAAFKAFGDPTRLEMLGLLLVHDEICVCDFVEVLGITQSKASRHLRYLVHAGVLEDRRAGLWVYYRVADGLAPDLRAALRGVQAALGPPRLAALRRRLARVRRRRQAAGNACPKTRPRGRRKGVEA